MVISRWCKFWQIKSKWVLLKVISKAQNAFVKDRQILDTVLVTDEAFDLIVRYNEGTILCKLDLEKAYNHVDLYFLCSLVKWVLEKKMDHVDKLVYFY